MENLMEKIISLCKRRGFIFPGSEIYGGLANSWDYGPLGVELKNNIKQEWWRRFVHQRTDMVGIDAALIMNPKVWEASGHVKEFSDPLVECKKCHERFRNDVIASEARQSEKQKIASSADGHRFSRNDEIMTCPNCGGELTEAKQFNLLFKTHLGPTEEKSNEVFLRGELAQAMFVDFPNVLQTTRRHLPFGIAAQGRVFRNEITPGNFIFRTREFDLMEFEYFTREDEWEKWFEYWLTEMKKWLVHIGVSEKNLHFHEIEASDRAHYSKRTIDIEYEYPFGRKELYGLAYRADFDLKNHMEQSGQDMRYTDPETSEKFLPHVVEPTFGLNRTLLVALLEAYKEEVVDDDTRVVLKFPYWLAPYKVAVLPLSKKEELTKIAKPLYEDLLKNFVCDYDETQSIGRRYRRQDEIGTPFCVTVDFETPKDHAVTVRDRDTMKQERVSISGLSTTINKMLNI